MNGNLPDEQLKMRDRWRVRRYNRKYKTAVNDSFRLSAVAKFMQDKRNEIAKRRRRKNAA